MICDKICSLTFNWNGSRSSPPPPRSSVTSKVTVPQRSVLNGKGYLLINYVGTDVSNTLVTTLNTSDPLIRYVCTYPPHYLLYAMIKTA